MNRHFRQHLAIQQNIRILQRIHELAIWYAVGLDGSRNARDPQPAKISFPMLTTGISICLPFIDRLGSCPKQLTLCPILSLRQFQSFFPAAPGLGASFYAWHFSFSFLTVIYNYFLRPCFFLKSKMIIITNREASGQEPIALAWPPQPNHWVGFFAWEFCWSRYYVSRPCVS